MPFEIIDRTGKEIPHTAYSIIESPLKGFLRIKMFREYCMEFQTNRFYVVDPPLSIGNKKSLFYDNVLINDSSKSITTYKKDGFSQSPFISVNNEIGGVPDPYGNVTYSLPNWGVRYIKSDGSILDFSNKSGFYWYGPDSKFYFQYNRYNTTKSDSVFVVNGKTHEVDTLGRHDISIKGIITIGAFQYMPSHKIWVRGFSALDFENDPKFQMSSNIPSGNVFQVKISNRLIYFNHYNSDTDHTYGPSTIDPLVDNSINSVGILFHTQYIVNYDDNLIFHISNPRKNIANIGTKSQYGVFKTILNCNVGDKVVIINCMPTESKKW